MSATAYVALMVLAWFVVIALVVSLFHAQKWIEETVEDELNAIAPAPCGPSRGEQRE